MDSNIIHFYQHFIFKQLSLDYDSVVKICIAEINSYPFVLIWEKAVKLLQYVLLSFHVSCMLESVFIFSIVVIIHMLHIYQKKKAARKTLSHKSLQTVISGSSTSWIRQNTFPKNSVLISCVGDLIMPVLCWIKYACNNNLSVTELCI